MSTKSDLTIQILYSKDETKLKLRIDDLSDETSCEIEVPTETTLSEGVTLICKELAKIKTQNFFGKFK